MLHPPAALLFDMDGTLTEPMLDFAAIKAEMNIGSQAILEAMQEMTPPNRRAAQAILDRHEAHAAAHSTLAPGCDALLAWAAAQAIPTALITRNSGQSVNVFQHRHRLRFHACISRDDCVCKPDPTPLRLACDRLGVAAADVLMIGDGHFDIEAGNAAGIRTVWLSLGRKRSFEAVPWREAGNLPELLTFLKSALPADLPIT